MTIIGKPLHAALLAAGTLVALMGNPAQAQQADDMAFSVRGDVWLGATAWPALGDLAPTAGGSFDSAGFGIGAGIYGTIWHYEHSQVLIGFDGFIAGTDSNVAGFFDDAIARLLYLGAGAKWAVGRDRSFSLGAGLGYYLADIAQVSSQYLGAEYEAWESSRLGINVGATWDVGAGRPGRNGGLMLALDVHFVDFGTARDEEVHIVPLLGPDAGRLDGPVYMLRVGYYWR